MPEHTPGPWATTQHGLILGAEEVWTNGRQRNTLGIASASYSEHVATIHGDITLPAPAANARLIAAAPDLLKACEQALAQLTGTGLDGTLGHHADNPIPAMLRKAIAKAKGETNA